MNDPDTSVPDWDLQQLEVILEDPGAWQLVVAGPGAGKSAVACQRVANLIDDGIPPSRILLVSFTRTAVAELRDRIVSYAVAGELARSARISTMDSYAWSLRSGFDDEPIAKSFGNESYDLNIARTVDLFREKQPDLCDFVGRLEHLIIDEAQDMVGVRAELAMEMLKTLPATCGVTILADPAQAIYDFTNEERNKVREQSTLLEWLDHDCPRTLTRRELHEVHRIKDEGLVELFMRTRKQVQSKDEAVGHVARMQSAIRETCGNDIGVTKYENVVDVLRLEQAGSVLVLFRRRADVLFASSYCSAEGIPHRIRMSDLPLVVQPWIGWLFGEVQSSILNHDEFDSLWESRSALATQPLEGLDPSRCWDLLHRIAAGSRPESIDLVQLRIVLSRTRPPIELCYPELGSIGPILGTIHASKGREADKVVLVMPPPETDRDLSDEEQAYIFEEGRVLYVGATRARQALVVASNRATKVGYLKSGRVFRRLNNRAQLEVGRAGDLDPTVHLSWDNRRDVQRALAESVGTIVPLQCRSLPENDYLPRVILEHLDDDGIAHPLEVGQMSTGFHTDLNALWGIVDKDKNLRPAPIIPHLYLFAVTTIGLTDDQLAGAKPPFNSTGIALAPVVKGFPMIQFLYRRGGRAR